MSTIAALVALAGTILLCAAAPRASGDDPVGAALARALPPKKK